MNKKDLNALKKLTSAMSWVELRDFCTTSISSTSELWQYLSAALPFAPKDPPEETTKFIWQHLKKHLKGNLPEVLCCEFEDLLLYVNDKDPDVKAIVQWRFRAGK